MNAAILQNILIFLERVPCTGKECGAWTETYQAVQAALTAAATPKLPTEWPPDDPTARMHG